MRARLHVRSRRAGFFREGTHELCDPAATQQLRPESTAALDAWLASGREAADAVEAVTVVENVAASERVLLIEPREGRRFEPSGPELLTSGLTGVSLQAGPRVVTLAGAITVRDTATDLFGFEPPIPSDAIWTRRASSFFQGNRFLIGPLVRRVIELAAGERVVDLYAGVGLFAVGLAATGVRVVAVEGDASSGADLEANARPFRDRLHVERAAVEAVVGTALEPPPNVVIVDPPRTGLSPAALRGIAAWRAPRIVYASCDPPTLARDAARLATSGYALSSIECLDLFPNTAHVESIAVFTLR
jgi:23S rRNA (uracil1939-C5)-methyltransferase